MSRVPRWNRPDGGGPIMGTAITFLNQKGGVGKTSTCMHLSGTLAKAGCKVLLLDCDPQGSLTNGFFGPAETRSLSPEVTITGLFDPRLSPFPGSLIRPTGIDGVSIVPGSRSLADYNMMSRGGWSASEHGIREFLEEVRGSFDLVLADAPPNLHLCSWAALVGSHGICVPLQCED
jgi:chromosome partitioning protein